MNFSGISFCYFRCCNNPWNQDDPFNSIACSPCLLDSKGYSGLDPNNFDGKVNFKDNFYLWSNGGWKDKVIVVTLNNSLHNDKIPYLLNIHLGIRLLF